MPLARRTELATERWGAGSPRGWGAPEVDLIKQAARVDIVGVGVPAADVGNATLDWPRLIELARAHGMLALVARTLRAQGWQGVPPDVIRQLNSYRAALTARNLFLSGQLLQILDLLAGHGIAALPYKGPVLAAYAYGDIGLRPFSDLDLLVSERDVLRARDLLIAEGYESLSPRTDAERPGLLPPGYALAVRSADGQVLVELHWKLAPSFPLTIEALLPRSRPFPLLGATAPCLSPDQFLLVLCVHGAKHGWERLEWVCGVAHLIARAPELDWERLAAEAHALGAAHAVGLGLALAERIAGAPVPAWAARRLGGVAAAPAARRLETALFRHAPGSSYPVARYARRLLAVSPEERVRYVRFLGRPTEKDRAFLALPCGLSFLYVLVRPLRVMREHARRFRLDREREPAARQQARRALARQLRHQQQKAARLRGREELVVGALAIRWDRVQRRLERVKGEWDDPRMLEVGSGAHGIVFGSGSSRAVGVDPLAVQYAALFPTWQPKLPTMAAVGEALPFPDGAFDVVVCDNVVDHCERPAAIVAELARVLVPGGLLYFTVNVHHRLYSLVAGAHRAWNAAGVRLEIGPFADHTVHLVPEEARQLLRDLPLDVRRERVYIAEARERAWRRRLRHPGHLLPLVFFKNARFEVIAQRR